MDDLAHRYLLVALGVGRLQEGIVDAYYGPPEIAAEADSRSLNAGQLAADAQQVQELAARDPDSQRALWLNRQLIGLETLARRLGGEEMSYIEEVQRCFDATPQPTPSAVYADAHAVLDNLLPPGGDLRERMEARSQRLTIPTERVADVSAWLIDQVRHDSDRYFAAPEGESLELKLVTNAPWSAYNWYDGNLRSRIEINTDLPVRASGLIGLVTHETFPGHHLEHAWKEQRLARERGRAEATAMLINTPEAYVSEGLGELGGQLVIDDERWTELFSGICEHSGIWLDDGEAESQRLINMALNELRAISADAALMLHHEGRPRGEVLAFIRETGLSTPERAAKTLEFITHSLWRTYVFCYSGGEALLTAWCAAAGDLDAQRTRFFRLLTEQLTPSGLAADIAA